MVKIFGLLLISLIFFLSESSFSKEVKIKGLIYQRYEGETLVWKLYSDYFEERDEEFKATKVYLENLPKGLKIFADFASYSKRENKFYLKGRVKILTENQGEIYTEELYYFPKSSLLQAPGEVTIIKNSIHLSGRELIYDLAKEELKLQKRAQARFKF